jgi:hypothetical protein
LAFGQLFFFSPVILRSFSRLFAHRSLLTLASGMVLAGCGHALPQLPGFDAAKWRADPYACRNQRRAAVPALTQSKEKLYEARADDVTALLGPPDEEELRAGTEKVYYYYLEPGTQCQGRHARSGAPCISLRFGPLGTVTEVLTDPLTPATP